MQEIKILNIRSEKLVNKGTWLILKKAVFKMSMKKWMLYQKSVKFKKNKAEITKEKKSHQKVLVHNIEAFS